MPVLKSKSATAENISAESAKVSENSSGIIKDTSKQKSVRASTRSSKKKVTKKKTTARKKKVTAKAKKKTVSRKKSAAKAATSVSSKKEKNSAADKQQVDEQESVVAVPAAEEIDSEKRKKEGQINDNTSTATEGAPNSPKESVVDVKSDTDPTTEGNKVEQTQSTASVDSTDKPTSASETSEQQADGSFVYILDEPQEQARTTSAAGAEQSLAGESDDAFLILFDTDEDDDQEATVDVSESGECKIFLPSDIRLARLNPLKDCFLNTLEAKSVNVEASRVKRTDAASYQLLWSYSTRLKDLNIPFQISGASEEFTESAGLLGLEL